MFFDDRLATVLRHRAAGERAARTQFRQLLDLLGSRSGARDQTLMAAAWLRLGALGEMLPAAERAAMIRDPGLRFRNPELALHLVEDEPEVAVAALARADLSDDDWQALIPRLPIRARGFLRLRRDMPAGAVRLLERLGIHDRGLPVPVTAEPADRAEQAEREMQPVSSSIPAKTISQPVAPIAEDSEITALVKRIEAFRQARSTGAPTLGPTWGPTRGPTAAPTGTEAPRLPLGDKKFDTDRPALVGFAFTTDAEGRIDWAENAVAPMVVGKRLAGDDAIPRAVFRRNQPVKALPVALEGARMIAGDWVVDAAPRFTRPGGRFYGYAGNFRRAAGAHVAAADSRESEADRIRQLLHELRTPVNAIQGFAEIIQQQLFGPTPHEYRALAATIAGDSARILAGFDELDRLARLETGALELEDGSSDLRAMTQRIEVQLRNVLQSRDAAFEVDLGEQACRVQLAQEDCEALGWRLLATLASALGPGETARVALERSETAAQLHCQLPAAMNAAEDIFAASAKPAGGALTAGMFGAGFALRLARAEAQAAGGSLDRTEGVLTLTLPLSSAAHPSAGSGDDTAGNAAPTAS